VRLLRIHSRTPATLPQRITPALVRLLGRFQPVYVNTHFNHPVEITPQAAAACARLADGGVPLGCQTVLLKGVNDDPAVMARLLRDLAAIRVRPYYLHHPDPVAGTAHFRPPLAAGLALMEALRGRISGICLPQYVIDLPGGGGKVPLLPESIVAREAGRLRVRNFQGQLYDYPLE
jgi:lysine 2,3-aminomutase